MFADQSRHKICRHFSVTDPRLIGFDDINQDFLLAHADTAGLGHIDILNLQSGDLVKDSGEYFPRASSDTAGSHANNDLGAGCVTNPIICLKLLPQSFEVFYRFHVTFPPYKILRFSFRY